MYIKRNRKSGGSNSHGGSKVNSLRQLSYKMAKANYMPSRNAEKNTMEEEVNCIYARLATYIPTKKGHYYNVPFEDFWTAIRKCKTELASWVSKRDVFNLYHGLPHLEEVYRDENMVIFAKRKGENQ